MKIKIKQIRVRIIGAMTKVNMSTNVMEILVMMIHLKH